MTQGLRHYTINNGNGRLEVRDKSHQAILSNKQRGVRMGEWMLIATQENDQLHDTRLTLVNQKTRAWTNDLSSATAAQAPVTQMVEAMSRFYSEEIKLPYRTNSKLN